MSGGSYNYVYFKIEDIEIRNTEKDPRRAAFQNLVKKVKVFYQYTDKNNG
jgi:hypothetical protein